LVAGVGQKGVLGAIGVFRIGVGLLERLLNACAAIAARSAARSRDIAGLTAW
jgi:hypothetical protein